MSDNYKRKYLKYKKKYLKLKKNYSGGSKISDLKREINNMENKIQTSIKCPCKEYSGEEQGNHTCYITNFNENKTQNCNAPEINTKQASIYNYRRWYRKCNPDFDDNCPTESNPSKVSSIIENTREQLRLEMQKEERKSKINELKSKVEKYIAPTYNGRVLLLNFMKPKENSYRGRRYHLDSGEIITLSDDELSEYPFNLINDALIDKAIVFREALKEKYKNFHNPNFPLLGKLDNKKLSTLSNNELEEMKKAAHVITNSLNRYFTWNNYSTWTSGPDKYYEVPAHISKIISDDYFEWRENHTPTPRR